MPFWLRSLLLPVFSLAASAASVAAVGAEPALIERDSLAFFNSAPRLLRQADDLAAWATAQRETYDLPEPDVLEWNPDAELPDSLAAWQAALSGQAITAEQLARPQDWLRLAALAERMATGWNEGGEAKATPVLARQALQETAAAAALNALLAATTPESVRSAALALAGGARAMGDDDTALRALATATRLPALAQDAALAAASDGIALTNRNAPPDALDEGQFHRVENWIVTCTNDLACTVTLDSPLFAMHLRRAAGPAGALHIAFVLTAALGPEASLHQRRAEDPPVTPHPAVWLDETPLGDDDDPLLPLRASPRLYDGWPAWEVPALRLDDVLALLIKAKMIAIGHDETAPKHRVPLAGLAKALGIVDEIQGRSGTETALTHRGPAPTRRVPPAPLVATRAALLQQEPGRAIAARPSAGALSLWRSLCPESATEAPLAPVSTQTDQGAEIWLLPCGTREFGPLFTAIHTQNGLSSALLDGFDLRSGTPPEPLRIAYPVLAALPANRGDNRPSPRPLALISETGTPCPSRHIWVWTDQGFAHHQSFQSPRCAASLLPIESYFAPIKEVQP